ncbi:MAG TPA: hypothetical protein VJT50_00775 [Pyrinomonadaceae bacterium]|nr:hypothetical protein [Pyrinomonadaceae bacterium]
MQLSDTNNPAERKKLIWALALGVVALILLWWTFIGFGGGTKTPSRPVASQSPGVPGPVSAKPSPSPATQLSEDILQRLSPVNFQIAMAAAPEARRNIFAYYERPVPVVVASVPTPTPTPTPPVLLATVSPANVYARTGDFTIEVTGDKFTPQLRIVVDNTELPTRYLSPQQLSATVPASLIANPGGRQVMAKSTDGTLYSNVGTLTVTAPPTPNYNYIGIIGTPRYIDTAILQDKSSKDTLNVQRGDLLSGRFRVTSISEKELVLMDTNLKIKHTIAYSQGGQGGATQRPTPRPESDDDEP